MEREHIKNEEKDMIKKAIEHFKHFGKMLLLQTKLRLSDSL